MKIPTIQGVIRRRILLNYRVDPAVLAAVLPGNFRAQCVGDYAIAGICLIRLEQIRPKGMPAMVGIASENSAHRIGVEWSRGGETQRGVFVPRRDTDSQLNALAGGRVFPGVHHLSKFEVEDHDGRIRMTVQADDYASPLVDFCALETETFPVDSVFDDLAASSAFFEQGCIGYSSCPGTKRLDGLLLKTERWKVSPLEVESVSSTYFDDRSIFPEGSIAFDHALLMRDIPHTWHSEPEMEAVEA
ncbi:DUF2071 domain-containing protein [Verrucomicrobiaceae bacterium 5K15]|uniref:DUF2071 domain-containing protein n=1 Tax=Oceaniferula flava TaxID=2800421 RepID=A0AAE2VDY3_9BACT|nr:DUF2071 domain-containing protein [Oceaniferula flavus]MBK1856481.1 DUF2071 domain-containing protein [Oceaniferula flavus]MBM1137788.1 DUF2071 domain-containing protein [Oceaniferula flavus]